MPRKNPTLITGAMKWIIGALSPLVIATGAIAQGPKDPPIGVLLASGDIAGCSLLGRHNAPATARVIMREISNAVAAGLPVRILPLGDLAYDHGSKEDFTCFDRSWGAFKSILLPVPGNHEYDNSPAGDALDYFAYFSDNPLVVSNGPLAGYYATGFPTANSSWLLIGLNAYLRGEALRKQTTWLRETLASNRAPCVLAFAHPFLLSSGLRGHRDGFSKTPRLLQDILPTFKLLYDGGATVLLTAHDHDFEQFAPHDPSGKVDERGVRSFVVGTGGEALYVSRHRSRWEASEAFSDASHGVLKLSLYARGYEWEFLPISGDKAIPLTVRADVCASRPPR